MAGRRSLTRDEERKLLRTVRTLPPRDRALICAQWYTGFRIHEILSLTVGSVFRDGEIRPSIGIAPRNLKGGYGRTRWVPVLPELQRALKTQLWWLGLRYELAPDLPLFPSRGRAPDGSARPLARSQASDIIKAAFTAAGIVDDGRLGTHSLRKTWARNVYEHSGRDILVVKRALGHSQISATERYLEADEATVMAAISACDFTRRPRQPMPAPAAAPTPVAA